MLPAFSFRPARPLFFDCLVVLCLFAPLLSTGTQAATTQIKSIGMGPPNYCSHRLSCNTYTAGLTAHGIQCGITESCWGSSVSGGISTPMTSFYSLPNISFTESIWNEPNKVCVRKLGNPTHCWNTTAGPSKVQLVYLGTCPGPGEAGCSAEDADNDGILNGTDTDDDNDGLLDGADNCPWVANANQLNTDSDAEGDVCDANDDNDGVPDASDAFPLDPAEWLDTDSDGTGNNGDMDDDNDGVPDYIDSNPLNAAVNTELLLPLDGLFRGSGVRETVEQL
jgi:hypothetical protein